MLRRADWLVLGVLFVGCGSGATGGTGDPSNEDPCANVTCSAPDECHVAGTCDGATGSCSSPAAPDGTACSTGTCSGGVCTAATDRCAGVVCDALDPCHPAGTCDSATGACVSEPAPDGTPCAGGLCSAGVCTAPDGSCVDGARNATETDVDCGGALCAGCVNGKACVADRDCMSGHCAAGRCATLVDRLVADPGPQRAVAPGVHVVLDATRSRSPSGPIATWSWVQTNGPAARLAGADTAHPSFDAPPGPEEAVLGFTLTVGDGTGTASAPLAVLVRAADRPAGTTSLGLILDAMSEGRIDRDTAMTYLAFSLSEDPLLPAEFQGTEGMPSGTAAKHILAAEFPWLSPATQELVRPFLLPPAAPGSWEPPLAGLRGLTAAPIAVGWIGVSSPHLVVWFRPSLANGVDIAMRLAMEAEVKIWPALRALFKDAHMPVLNDAAVDLRGGRHGKLNVYLKPGLPKGAYGSETPLLPRQPSPTFIELDETLPSSGRPMGLFECLAHEMTHSCQDSYRHAQDYPGHRWIYEGTAAWAQDYVYPATNTEHTYAPGWLNAPWLSLDDDWGLHPYGTYLFFQSVTRPLNDADFVRRVFENFQTLPALEAVELALPNDEGYEIAWRALVAAAWNRDPADDFWGLDGLAQGAKVRGPAPVEMQLQGSDDLAYEMDVRLRHLAASYAHVSFPDPTARQIFFYDGYLFDLTWVDSEGGRLIAATPRMPPDPLHFPFMSTAVLAGRGGSWERVLPISGVMLACQDDPAERIDELAVGFGYGFPAPGATMAPGGLEPRLWMSNIGCYRWSGTVSGSTSPSALGPPEEITAQVTFVRDFRDVPEVLFSVAEGSFTWRTWGSWEDCSYTGSAAWTGSGPQEGMLRFAPQIVDGPWHRGYEGLAYGHDVTYEMTCPDGNGGTVTTTATKTVYWLDTFDAAGGAVPQFSPDGLTAAGTADDGNMVYTWSFTSTPGQ